MKKLFDKIKKNNKGFTLVELIVVVAILAVITVVVAPQYLSYVNKARIGTDENTIGEIAHVAEISFVEKRASNDKFMEKGGTVTIEISDGAFTIKSSDAKEEGKTTLADEISKVVASNQYKFKSNEYKNHKGVVITLNANGIASWTKVDGTVMGAIGKTEMTK